MPFSGLDLLTITTILFSVVFWLPLELRPVAKVSSGILSIMGWFIVALLTVINFETGWMWAMFYVAIGVISMILLISILLDAWGRAGRRF